MNESTENLEISSSILSDIITGGCKDNEFIIIKSQSIQEEKVFGNTTLVIIKRLSDGRYFSYKYNRCSNGPGTRDYDFEYYDTALLKEVFPYEKITIEYK